MPHLRPSHSMQYRVACYTICVYIITCAVLDGAVLQ